MEIGCRCYLCLLTCRAAASGGVENGGRSLRAYIETMLAPCLGPCARGTRIRRDRRTVNLLSASARLPQSVIIFETPFPPSFRHTSSYERLSRPVNRHLT